MRHTVLMIILTGNSRDVITECGTAPSESYLRVLLKSNLDIITFHDHLITYCFNYAAKFKNHMSLTVFHTHDYAYKMKVLIFLNFTQVLIPR